LWRARATTAATSALYLFFATQPSGLLHRSFRLQREEEARHRRIVPDMPWLTADSRRTVGEFEYRIKSVNEPHERVARESELTKA
jgi:hypothetical protein